MHILWARALRARDREEAGALGAASVCETVSMKWRRSDKKAYGTGPCVLAHCAAATAAGCS